MVSIFESFGGSGSNFEVFRYLVERFYFYMDSLPEVKIIRDMHHADLAEAQEKLFLFLVGWTGGPQLYMEKHGHPRLRARHLPFFIGERERDMWMLCMEKALADCADKFQLPAEALSFFKSSLGRLATHMINMTDKKC